MKQNKLAGTHSPVHESAISHVQGCAEFVDDRPPSNRELVLGLVYSPHARAHIRSIQTEKALLIPGCVKIFSARDLKHNRWGSIFQDQPFLAVDHVEYVGEVILVVAAEDDTSLRQIIAAIKIEYDVLRPILSIEQARQQDSFIGSERKIERGDWQSAQNKASHRLSGDVRIDGADHFYLENQAALAYPIDGGMIEVHSSTQHPTEVQHQVADALGLRAKDVICQATRLGGAFGGKESQAAPFAVYAALAAHVCRRPARMVLNKDDDMLITGKRNPFQVTYDVAFDQEGQILALDARLFSDGGAYADLSTAIMERALTHVDNAYYLPSVRIRGQVCRTNFHPHTAFRGFGGPKGVALIEHAMEAIAHKLAIDAFDVRLRNCYRSPDRNITPYGQTVTGDQLPLLFETLAARCHYRQRRQQLTATPTAQTLRGMAITPVKFGISFITRFLNQANSLIHLHLDGSLQISTGAVEMGQGVHTRIAGMVAAELGIPINSIQMMPTRTDKNANTSATAASSGADMNGAATIMACRALKDRLAGVFLALMSQNRQDWPSRTVGLGVQPDLVLPTQGRNHVKFANGKVFHANQTDDFIPFEDVVREAYFNRVSLSEYGFYKVDPLDFNKVTGQGRAFLYYTMGVACSEVEVDRITGEVKVLRSDILMDLGRPINEALDIGQIRGAFIQGLGWLTTEKLVYSDHGRLLTHSPSTYKIPTIQDIPRTLNIDLIDSTEPLTLHHGKAVGEPPLLLSFSVWAAIMNALSSEKQLKPFPSLAIPATRERILRQLYPETFARWESSSS